MRPAWTFVKLYVGKQGFRDGLEGLAFCALSGLSVAVRHWKHPELIRTEGVMTLTSALYENEVAAHFDELEARFKSAVAPTDYRLTALLEFLDPLAETHVLDLGCGKGRFASRFSEQGADVVGLDVSAAMLGAAVGLARCVARRGGCRSPTRAFDAVVAVEMFEHLPALAVDAVLLEIRRV